MENKMVKQFSLTKLMLALAITLQFSAMFADIKVAHNAYEKNECPDKDLDCHEYLKKLLVTEATFTDDIFDAGKTTAAPRDQSQTEKNFESFREKSITENRTNRLYPALYYWPRDHYEKYQTSIKQAEKAYLETLIGTNKEKHAKMISDQNKKLASKISKLKRINKKPTTLPLPSATKEDLDSIRSHLDFYYKTYKQSKCYDSLNGSKTLLKNFDTENVFADDILEIEKNNPGYFRGIFKTWVKVAQKEIDQKLATSYLSENNKDQYFADTELANELYWHAPMGTKRTHKMIISDIKTLLELRILELEKRKEKKSDPSILFTHKTA